MATTAIIENQLQKSFPCASKDVFASEKLVSPSPSSKDKEIFRDICVVKSLNKAKFPVYLICSKVNKKNYAMKVFPHKNGVPHTYFKNEIRFASLQHHNVIKNLHTENEKDTISKGVVSKVSYTVMEYAPHGDFFDLVMNHGSKMDEKLARFYFKQMIDGIEYLHSCGVSHMDLKLENMLVGEDYTLKIADFDLSYIDKDPKIISKGTKFYRAPDVMIGKCKDTRAADVYAAGIILFTFKTKGILPHSENNLIAGINFSDLLHDNDEKFWTKHGEIQKKDQSFFDKDFKELFIAMTRPEHNQRITISEIKRSKWYNGPSYTADEVKTKVAKFFAN